MSASSEDARRLARREASKRWREANREAKRASTRRWKKANPDKAFAATAAWRLKTTQARIAQLCAITHCECCGVELTSGGRTKRCIDHCHDSGKIRGVLCLKCNLALGMADDDVAKLQAMIGYLNKHQHRSAN